ncbi:hypothetical protein HPY86_06385 [candidate division WOR-3 bacterium]|nr:hypothetical protein [candidate division WOR-3 bacterium]
MAFAIYFAVWVSFNPVFSTGIKNGQQDLINHYDGFAKTSLGQPPGGILGYQIRATKIPPDITRTTLPNTGGLYSIAASEIGLFNVGDTIRVHLDNYYRPQDSSNMVHVVTPEDTSRPWQYLPELCCDSSLVQNRAHTICVRNVYSPDSGEIFLEYYLSKDPSHRDTVPHTRGINSADAFFFNLEHLPQPANDGDTVYMHIGLFNIVGNDTIFNDTIYLDTFAWSKDG